MIKKGIARTYAKAIIKSAPDDSTLKEWRRQLVEVSDVISSSAQLEELLIKPVLPVERRKELLNTILSKVGCDKVVSNLLNLMLQNYRLNHLKLLIELIDEEIDKKEGIVRGEFITAYPVERELVERAEEELSKILNKKVILNHLIRKEIIGGAIIKIGSMEIDGSILRRINSIETINIF